MVDFILGMKLRVCSGLINRALLIKAFRFRLRMM